MSIQSRTILITGCSSGFGERIARRLAAAGHHVFAAMRGVDSVNAAPAAALREWTARHGVHLDVVDIDVTSDESIRAAVAAILDSTGRIDIVVNNAGRGAIGPMEAFTMAQVESLFSVNVYGAMRVNRAVLPSMRHRSGLIVHVSSTIGRVLPNAGGLYAGTKWALEGLAESLSYEVKAFGIDVVILEPGAFPSPALSKAMVADDVAVRSAYTAASAQVDPPSGQQTPADYLLPDLEEVADAVAQIVAMPAGQRPLRTIVGPIFTEGVAEYNASYDRARVRLTRALQRPDQAITWGVAQQQDSDA